MSLTLKKKMALLMEEVDSDNEEWEAISRPATPEGFLQKAKRYFISAFRKETPLPPKDIFNALWIVYVGTRQMGLSTLVLLVHRATLRVDEVQL